MAIKLEKGIPIFSFVDDQGNEYRFESAGDVTNFVEEERDFWTEVTYPLGDELWRGRLVELINDGLKILKYEHPYEGHVLTGKPEHNSTEKFDRTIVEYRIGILPTRTSALASALQKAFNSTNMAQQFGQMRQHIARFLLSDFSPDLKELTVAAREEAQGLRSLLSVIEGKSKGVVKTLNEMTKQSKSSEELGRQIDDKAKEANRLLKNFPLDLADACTAAANDAASKAAATVLADQELREPQEYWAGREKDHKESRDTFMIAFFGLCLGAGIVIPALAFLVFGARIGEAHENWTIAFALLGVPSLLAVWVIRMVGKIHGTHQALETDAAERVTMMKAFIALNSSNKLTPDDKHLILKALFRPSQHVAEEEPMPSWIDAVFARAGSQSK